MFGTNKDALPQAPWAIEPLLAAAGAWSGSRAFLNFCGRKVRDVCIIWRKEVGKKKEKRLQLYNSSQHLMTDYWTLAWDYYFFFFVIFAVSLEIIRCISV